MATEQRRYTTIQVATAEAVPYKFRCVGKIARENAEFGADDACGGRRPNDCQQCPSLRHRLTSLPKLIEAELVALTARLLAYLLGCRASQWLRWKVTLVSCRLIQELSLDIFRRLYYASTQARSTYRLGPHCQTSSSRTCDVYFFSKHTALLLAVRYRRPGLFLSLAVPALNDPVSILGFLLSSFL